MSIPTTLEDALRAGRVIPFVGAGISMAVLDRDTSQRLFPSWTELLHRAADRLDQEQKAPYAGLVRNFLLLDTPNYLEAARHARAGLGSVWFTFLKEHLDYPRERADDASLRLAQSLWNLGSPLLITTNYDRVLRWACPRQYDLDIWDIEAPAEQVAALRSGVRRPTIWHLHGQINNATRLILTPDGYQRLYPEDGAVEGRYRAALATLRSFLTSKVFLFVGFSLDDHYVTQQVRGIEDMFQGTTGPHYVLVQESARDRVMRLQVPSVEVITFPGFGAPLVECLRELGRIATHTSIPTGALGRLPGLPGELPQPPAFDPPNADRVTTHQPTSWQVRPHPVGPETLAAAERQLTALPLEMIPNPAPLPPGSRMPLRRNPLFVGREADLRALATALKGSETAAIGQTAAIVGLGGMGKTQLASEFVHRYGQFFAGGVFWLSFADPAAVLIEVAACSGPGALALHPAFHTLPMADQVQVVHAAWQSPLPRLLVFDNCEDEALLDQWQPRTGGCRVVITSRRPWRDLSLLVHEIRLDVFTRKESMAFLRYFRPDVPMDDPKLAGIAQELGDLPLALHLTGSFLRTYRSTSFGDPAAYLDQLRQDQVLAHASLQGRGAGVSPTRHDLNVDRMISLGYGQLCPRDPLDQVALGVLDRVACFALGVPIPPGLLMAAIAGVVEDELQAEDALVRLVDLGLLERQADGSTRMHPLVAAFVHSRDAAPEAQSAVEDAVLIEAKSANASGDPRSLLAWQTHLRHVTDAARERADERAVSLCEEMGHFLHMVGDYRGAQLYFERVLALRERGLGPEHPAVATSLNDLAELYHAQGRYAEAEPLLQRALALRERVLKPEHPDVAQSLNNLAELYHAQGRYAEAEPLLQRALALRERVLGPERPSVATSLGNLALLYKTQGRYREAEPLYQRALALRERVLGANHPDVATSLNNLATLYCAQGRYAEAEPLYQRALALREQMLGPEHPQTVAVRENYAALLRAMDRTDSAPPSE